MSLVSPIDNLDNFPKRYICTFYEPKKKKHIKLRKEENKNLAKSINIIS